MHSLTTIGHIEKREAEAREILAQDHTRADNEAEARLARDISEAQNRLQPAAS